MAIPIRIQNSALRKGGVLNFNQTKSTSKQLNSNELGDADGLKYGDKPTKYEAEF